MLQLPETESPQAPPRRSRRSSEKIDAGNAAIVAAFQQMEFGIADLVQITSIASTLVESYGQQAVGVENTPWTAKQAMQELKKTGGQLMFMTYEVEQKALALRDEWEAAASAGDHTFNEPEDQDSDGDEDGNLTAITSDRDRWKLLALAHEAELKSLRTEATTT